MDFKNSTVVQQRNHLLELPTELVEHIVGHLSVHEFSTFRLTNRRLHDKSSDFFIKRFFACRIVKLQPQNLRNLVKISEHPQLAKQVRCLEITPEHHEAFNRITVERITEKWTKHHAENLDESTTDHFNCMQKSLHSLQSRIADISARDVSLATTGLVTALLTRAFLGFGSLESLRYGLVDSGTPYWDDQTMEYWNSSGLPEVTGIESANYDWKRSDKFWTLHRSRYLDYVLSAMVASGITLSRLVIEDGAYRVKDCPRLDVPEALVLQNSFKHLKHLHFSLSVIHTEDNSAKLEDVRCFFGTLPDSIEELGLSTSLEDDIFTVTKDLMTTIFIWSELLKGLKFPRLRHLKLGNACASLAPTLYQFISDHRSSLRTVHIRPCEAGGWDAKMNRVRWSAFLDLFLSIPNLDEVFLEATCDIYDKVNNITCQERLGLHAGRIRMKEKMNAWQQIEDAAGLS